MRTGIIAKILNILGQQINPSTEDKQDDVITQLTTIAGDTTSIDGKVATEAKQDNIITKLGDIETNQTDGSQKTQIVDNLGANEDLATEAKQDTIITGLSAIEANQTDGSQTNKIVGIDWVSGNSGIDRATETLQTIEYEHHEIHAGSHYVIIDTAELAINNVYDMQFTTPDNTKWTHLVFKLDCESKTEWYIYEGAVITTAGDEITPINNDRNSANLSGNTVAGILNTSLVNANADTDVSGATQIAHGIVGSGKNSLGADTRDNEIILKQNTIYCFRAIAKAAGYIDFDVEFYEHTNKN